MIMGRGSFIFAMDIEVNYEYDLRGWFIDLWLSHNKEQNVGGKGTLCMIVYSLQKGQETSRYSRDSIWSKSYSEKWFLLFFLKGIWINISFMSYNSLDQCIFNVWGGYNLSQGLSEMRWMMFNAWRWLAQCLMEERMIQWKKNEAETTTTKCLWRHNVFIT